MLELKVRQLTDSQIEFLRRWDAEDSEELRRSSPRSHGFPSPMTVVLCAQVRVPPLRRGGM